MSQLPDRAVTLLYYYYYYYYYERERERERERGENSLSERERERERTLSPLCASSRDTHVAAAARQCCSTASADYTHSAERERTQHIPKVYTYTHSLVARHVQTHPRAQIESAETVNSNNTRLRRVCIEGAEPRTQTALPYEGR